VRTIEKNVLYRSSLENVSIGNLNRDQVLAFLGNGRQCGVLLETQISNLFDDLSVPATQGDNADLISDHHGSIQAKTFHFTDETFFKTGKRKGESKHSNKSIYVSKSSLWDSKKRRKQLGEDVDRITIDYIRSYDYFLLIDISKMKDDLSFSWILIDSPYISERHHDGLISINDVKEKINRKVTLH
jgi:hypothetical protein